MSGVIDVRYLVLDVDDTLTLHGRIMPEVGGALLRAAGAGIEVILNTGRSAGWGAALHSYLPGVQAVVVENGGAWFDGPGGGHREVPVQFLASQPPERQRLFALRAEAARRTGLELVPTADDPFRLSDHTVVRGIGIPHGPAGTAAAAVIERLRQAVLELTAGQGGLLASSVHLHFFLEEGEGPRRSKAHGVAALLARRGVPDPERELSQHAIAVGDSGNDASLFVPGRFALGAAVRNIERYLPELETLGEHAPRHITRAAEGEGVIELIDDLLAGRLPR